MLMKLNNKGFAISTVLYSLLIMVFLIVVLMMSIMASNRKSTNNLVEAIEDELNRYNQTSTIIDYNDSVDYQTYVVPSGQSGWYKIELYGAQGGSSGSNIGGKGAYTSGLIYLKENEKLYFYIGGTTSSKTGGKNGGGSGAGDGLGGGGSTDVRIKSGDWNNQETLKTRIMVAGGGGGANKFKTGSSGGNAGGIVGRSGSSNNITNADYTNAKYGGQTGPEIDNFLNINKAENCNSGYIKSDADDVDKIIKACGKLGAGGSATNNNGGGGGSGFIGGGAGSTDTSTTAGSGAGGSSFIAGYSGVMYSYSGTGTEVTYYNEKDRYFINGQMAEGVNEGNGKAIIKLVSTASQAEKPAIKNTKLQNVRYIKKCTKGTALNKKEFYIAEIVAMKDGINVAKGKGGTTLTDGNIETMQKFDNSTGEIKCTTIDLGSVYSLDEITIFNNPAGNIDKTYSEQISVSANNSTWTQLIYSENTSVPEYTSGIRYTAWDLDYEAALPASGIYQIQSALSPNSRGISAINSNTVSSVEQLSTKQASLSVLGDGSSQNWSIIKNDDGTYRIIETESNHALQISDMTGSAGAAVNTISEYYSYETSSDYEWTKWIIEPLRDGTYTIKTKAGSKNCLSTISANYNTSSNINIQNCSTDNFAQRWIIKSVNF